MVESTTSTIQPYFSTTPIVYNSTGNMINAALCVFLFCAGTLANVFSIVYFISCNGYKTTTKFLYLSISIVDLVICILVLPVGVSYFNDRAAVFFGWWLFCNVWGVFWNACTRLSVFLIAVLSITRTITLVQPLFHIRQRIVVGITVFYCVGQVIQASIPFWYNVKYTYKSELVQCSWYVNAVFESGSVSNWVVSIILVNVEIIAPIFPITIGCITTIIVLQSSGRHLTQSGSQNKLKNSATITIILVTLNYIIFNLPLAVFLTMALVDELSGWRFNFFGFEWPDLLFSNLVVDMAVVLNSFMNPVLYFLRLKGMRGFAVEGIRKMGLILRGKGGGSVTVRHAVELYGLGSDSRLTVLSSNSRDKISTEITKL